MKELKFEVITTSNGACCDPSTGCCEPAPQTTEPTVTEGIVQVEVYDPPMCCPTGVCGPTLDERLVNIQEALGKLEKEYEGKVKIHRYMLTQHPVQFVNNSTVAKIMAEEKTDGLPVTLVGGELLKKKEYPSYQELKEAIEKKLS
jgi:hypothetical protein